MALYDDDRIVSWGGGVSGGMNLKMIAIGRI